MVPVSDSASQSRPHVTPDECEEMRSHLATGVPVKIVAKTFQRNSKTVREHGHGECDHDIDRPAVEEFGQSAAFAQKTASCESMRLLYERPRTRDEFHDGYDGTVRRLGGVVARLEAPSTSRGSGGGSFKTRGRTKTIYYLYGDERRAVREFVRANTDYVESCLGDQFNPLRANWDETLWRLLLEEWQLYQTHYEGGERR